jgi:hypothetical protein
MYTFVIRRKIFAFKFLFTIPHRTRGGIVLGYLGLQIIPFNSIKNGLEPRALNVQNFIN